MCQRFSEISYVPNTYHVLPEFSQETEMVVVFTCDCSAICQGHPIHNSQEQRPELIMVSVRLGQANATKRNKLQVPLT